MERNCLSTYEGEVHGRYIIISLEVELKIKEEPVLKSILTKMRLSEERNNLGFYVQGAREELARRAVQRVSVTKLLI